MEANDHDLDDRLRALAAPPPEVATRVAARALAAPPRGNRHRPGMLIAAGTAGALLLAIGLRYWPLHPAAPPSADLPDHVGLVLVRAPDGSSLIFSTSPTTPLDTGQGGSGFVMAEGGHE